MDEFSNFRTSNHAVYYQVCGGIQESSGTVAHGSLRIAVTPVFAKQAPRGIRKILKSPLP
jgi:hypothetical protein